MPCKKSHCNAVKKKDVWFRATQKVIQDTGTGTPERGHPLSSQPSSLLSERWKPGRGWGRLPAPRTPWAPGWQPFPCPWLGGPSTTWTQQAGIQTAERWEKPLAPLKSPGPATDFTEHVSSWKQIYCFYPFFPPPPTVCSLLRSRWKPLVHKTTLLLSFPACCFYSCVMRVLKSIYSRPR